jgi:hypothetical protein
VDNFTNITLVKLTHEIIIITFGVVLDVKNQQVNKKSLAALRFVQLP